MVPAYSSVTLTNVLPHRNAIPQTQDIAPHLVTVYRLRDDLSLCYPLMCNITLEYTTTQCLTSDPTGKSFHDLPHTPVNAQPYDAVMVLVSQKLGIKCIVPDES